jgi:hypothetical protein
MGFATDSIRRMVTSCNITVIEVTGKLKIQRCNNQEDRFCSNEARLAGQNRAYQCDSYLQRGSLRFENRNSRDSFRDC